MYIDTAQIECDMYMYKGKVKFINHKVQTVINNRSSGMNYGEQPLKVYKTFRVKTGSSIEKPVMSLNRFTLSQFT